jgi:hypothetical protein
MDEDNSDYSVVGNWEKWFAWHPVQLVGKRNRWRWVKTIYRRPMYRGYGDSRYFAMWFYGDILDVLTDI